MSVIEIKNLCKYYGKSRGIMNKGDLYYGQESSI